jgi:hypothetical protein
MTNFNLLNFWFKIPDKIFFFSVKYFFSIIFKFYIKRKIPLYTFDTFLKVAAPAKLTNNKNKKYYISF